MRRNFMLVVLSLCLAFTSSSVLIYARDVNVSLNLTINKNAKNPAIISTKKNLTSLDPNHEFVSDETRFSDGNPSIFTPVYENGFGYQVKVLNKNYAEVEVINTGENVLQVDETTIGFFCYKFDNKNVSGNTILEGAGTLKPGETRLVKLEAKSPDNTGSFHVQLNGLKGGLPQCIITQYWGDYNQNSETIGSIDQEAFTSLEPVDVAEVGANIYTCGWEELPADQWIVTPSLTGLITGNGKFKVQALGLKVLENTHIEGIPDVEKDGGYVLVRYRFANTSSKPVSLDNIKLYTYYPSKDNSKDYTIELKPNSEVITDMGLKIPSVVEAKSIVDFYIPAFYINSTYLASIIVETSAGKFQTPNIGSLIVR